MFYIYVYIFRSTSCTRWWILISPVGWIAAEIVYKLRTFYIKLPMSATFHLWNFNVFAYILIAHSRSLSRKNTFSLHVLCVKTHWRFLPEVSHVYLSVATNAVDDDREWWYAAFPLMLICFMLITLHNDGFPNRQSRWLNERNVTRRLINQT